jgi:aconitase A
VSLDAIKNGKCNIDGVRLIVRPEAMPRYTDVIEIDFSAVRIRIAGPGRNCCARAVSFPHSEPGA